MWASSIWLLVLIVVLTVIGIVVIMLLMGTWRRQLKHSARPTSRHHATDESPDPWSTSGERIQATDKDDEFDALDDDGDDFDDDDDDDYDDDDDDDLDPSDGFDSSGDDTDD